MNVTGPIDYAEARRIVREAIERGWAHMPLRYHEKETKEEAPPKQESEPQNDGNSRAETIHGLRVTRELALEGEGLGNPSEWETQSEEARQEFKAKPEVPDSVQRITAYHGNCRWCGSTRAPVDGHCLRCGRTR